MVILTLVFFISIRRRHTISKRDWSSDVCSSDLSPNHILYYLIWVINYFFHRFSLPYKFKKRPKRNLSRCLGLLQSILFKHPRCFNRLFPTIITFCYLFLLHCAFKCFFVFPLFGNLFLAVPETNS